MPETCLTGADRSLQDSFARSTLWLLPCCVLLIGLALQQTGCSCFSQWSVACKDQGWPAKPGQQTETSQSDESEGPPKDALPICGSGGECYRYRIREKTPKTLFDWAVGEQKKKDDDQDEWEIQWEVPLDTDRPDFGAATTTVGKGLAILETGYSYFHDQNDRTRFVGQDYPEALLRVGLFADWFEFRIGQNFGNFRTTAMGTPVTGGAISQNGAEDLYLGTKLALTEQKGCLPESVVIIQSTVPSGSPSLTAGQVLPGAIYLFGWDIGETGWELSGLIEADRAVDHADHAYVQVAQTLEVIYKWTKRTKTFVEWVALYPTGAIAPDALPQYYIHPGIMYLVSNNIQLDFHMFIGLNKPATDFFGGPGMSIRF
jgi:hypothetical protein